jgi:hypothetical protein
MVMLMQVEEERKIWRRRKNRGFGGVGGVGRALVSWRRTSAARGKIVSPARVGSSAALRQLGAPRRDKRRDRRGLGESRAAALAQLVDGFNGGAGMDEVTPATCTVSFSDLQRQVSARC